MASEDARKLFVAGLPDSVTEEVLRDLFVEVGVQVTELALPRDRTSGRPRGFAFVSLGSVEDAEGARRALDGRAVGGKVISVRPFQTAPPQRRDPPGDRPARRDGDAAGPASDRTLYVGNLPYDATPEEVEAALMRYSVDGIARTHLPLDAEGRRRGFGFVTFQTAAAARAAVDALQGAEIHGRRLTVNLAYPKGSTSNSNHDGPRASEGLRSRPASEAGASSRSHGPPPVFAAPPPKANEPRRRRKFDHDGEGGPRPRGRREYEERWRDDDDDE